jgi:hypothetical protein
MRSAWISYHGKKILRQNFSGIDLDRSELIEEELMAVQEIVVAEPENSVLILADFSGTTIGKDLMDAMQTSSAKTKNHVRKTAVLGVTGTKRILANMLMSMTGQKLVMFTDEEEAKQWLIKD